MSKENGFSFSINPLTPCKKYNLPFWQCPQFLFFIMGLIILAVVLSTYLIATFQIDNPRLVALIVLLVGGFLFIIDYIIISSFERIADASRMKTEFIGIVSHQLRSPLTNLKFSLDLLMSGRLGKVAESEIEYFRILKENTQRMGELINDLIVVSRIESGEFPLKRVLTSLAESTERIIEKNRAFAEASNIEIITDIEKDLPPVLVDSLWLEQVIKNLIDNAIRYTKGKGEIRIKVRRAKNKVCFEVKDQGVGIPKPEQKFVFRKFFRSKNAVRHQTEGSGLGLHIAKRVLEIFGGKIWFESEENKGTTFYFTLPVKRRKIMG